MEPLGPNASPDDYQTAAPVIPQMLTLAFRDGSHFRGDVLAEQDVD